VKPGRKTMFHEGSLKLEACTIEMVERVLGSVWLCEFLNARGRVWQRLDRRVGGPALAVERNARSRTGRGGPRVPRSVFIPRASLEHWKQINRAVDGALGEGPWRDYPAGAARLDAPGMELGFLRRRRGEAPDA